MTTVLLSTTICILLIYCIYSYIKINKLKVEKSTAKVELKRHLMKLRIEELSTALNKLQTKNK